MGSRLENKSTEIRKRIENHTFEDEKGEEYGGSKFGGFSDYFRRKKIKLQNLDAELRAQITDEPQIFRGIVCNVNGYTQPSLNDLHEMIVRHGGGFMQYLDGKTMVTHIIASSLTPKKVVEFRRYRIVKPAWIVDSIKAGRLLAWNDYRVVDEGAGQKLLGFQDGKVISQVNNKQKGYRDQTDASWYTSQFQQESGPSSAPAKEDIGPWSQTSTHASSLNESEILQAEELAQQAEQSKLQALEELANANSPISSRAAESQLQTPPPSSLSQPEGPNLNNKTSISPVKEIVNHAVNDLHPRGSEDKQSPQKQTSMNEEDASITEYPIEPRGIKRTASVSGDKPNKATKLTAEEHNAVLLADPRTRKSTVVNPDFLEQYYRESRLHHLSTWKADLKSQLRALTEQNSATQQARQKRPPGARRYIMHVDFDSFFVAVSLKKCPHLKDKPCVVAHGGGSGSEIASCNYPARKFGVSNGMWMKKAQELCQNLEVLPYDFPAYEEASRKFYDAILSTDGIVQSVSVDEALVDISMLCIAIGGTDGVRRAEGSQHREQTKANEIASSLRTKVLEETGCNVSVGLGSNILLAKLALRKAKPAGQFQVVPEAVLDFIGDLEVQNLPGVAGSLGSKLEELSIRYVKDIRECTKEKLISKLGPKTGEKLWDYARGIDRTEVGDVVIRKSVSAEVNWGVRFENQDQVDEFMESLCCELEKRLVKEKVKGRQLTLKLMRRAADAPLDPPKHLGHGKCDTYNKSIQLGVYTHDTKVIYKEIMSIMKGFGFPPGELRGIGIQMQKLEPIKIDSNVDGSQRRLQFVLPDARLSPEARDEQIVDTVTKNAETPKMISRLRDKAPSAMAMAVGMNVSSPSKKPLNITGTQFMLPTQVDPAVLAELPEEIRTRLIRGSRPKFTKAVVEEKDIKPADVSRSNIEVALPNQSQLDPEMLASLPSDVRDELLALYKTSTVSKAKGQAVLPQSPRKNRTLPPSKIAGPIKRRGGRSGGGLFNSRNSSNNNNNTLTQSNFVARTTIQNDLEDEEGPDTDLDADFLAALPVELRQEVLDNHRQERLRQKGGIDLSLHNQRTSRARQKNAATAQVTTGERIFHLAPRQPLPTFTKAKLDKIEDLRFMILDWVGEFIEEPPFDEDVNALIVYLKAIVHGTDGQSGDMEKAFKVVKWLEWCLEEVDWGLNDNENNDQMSVRQGWNAVLKQVKEGVQEAVKGRGLGCFHFGN